MSCVTVLQRILSASLVMFIAFAAAPLAAEEAIDPLRIDRISPEGEGVPLGHEIVFQFSEHMVPLGRMERKPEEIPIEITPRLNCQWRWLSTSALACRLDESDAFRPAVTYRIVVDPAFIAMNGAKLPAEKRHEFTTLRPAVSFSRFYQWRGPGEPRFLVTMNLPIEERALNRRLVVRRLDTGERFDVDAKLNPKWGERTFLVRPKAVLPGGANFQLVLEAGLQSESGPAPSLTDHVVQEFRTIPEFRFLGVRCYSANDEEIEIAPETPGEPGKVCDPMRSISLAFSSPVVTDGVRKGMALAPNPVIGKEVNLWDLVYSYSQLGYRHEEGHEYTIMLPSPLKALTTYTVDGDAAAIRDEFGRTLQGSVRTTFATSDREPDLLLTHRTSVLETGVDSHLPLFLTNLENFTVRFSKLTAGGLASDQKQTISGWEVKNLAYKFPLKVRELLGGRSGVIEGSIDSASRSTPRFFSQVTPFSVHLKLGHFNSLAWITRFDNGEPVRGATAQLYRGTLRPFRLSAALGAAGKSSAEGVAALPGSSEIDPTLALAQQWDEAKERLFLKVQAGDDIAVVPVSYDLSVYAGGAGGYQRPRYGHLIAWGTTAQGIYRLGDTVQYKIYVRNQDNRGLTAPPKGSYTLTILDPMSKTVAERTNLSLSQFGALDGAFEIPKRGTVGWYRFVLKSSFSKESREPLTVLVSDFTPAPFRVTTGIKGAAFESGDSVPVETQAKLHSGGPWSDAATRLVGVVDPAYLELEDPALRNFEVTVRDEDEYLPSTEVYQKELKLDSDGELAQSFRLPELPVLVGKLTVESSVRDDRGKYVSASATAKVFARDRYVAVEQRDWVLEAGKESRARLAVVDRDGALVPGVKIQLSVQHRETTAARVMGPGNSYLTEYKSVWVESRSFDYESGSQPLEVTFTPARPGTLRLAAHISDTKGRDHSTFLERWVIGAGSVLFEQGNDNELEVVSEKKSYALGETAKFLIKNPYPNARALYTIERFGIMKSWSAELSDSSAIVEVPVTEDMIPGFYFSATVFSPRVDKPIEGEAVDLGKPTFRSGYVSVPVSDRAKELEVTARAEKEVYKPREAVTVQLEAKPRSGSAEPIEFAVAVLDESVFDLISAGSSYFDPYQGFYTLGSLDVRNYNLLAQLIGRQKFEKKGANPGGDGGDGFDFRSLIKYVSYWNPSVRADGSGRASVSFELPDNLTGWRVLALAVTKTQRMGLGQGTFKANQPIEIRPALPNQLRQGDEFTARFTVTNRTDEPRNLTVKISAAGAVGEPLAREETVSAKPFERAVVALPLKAVQEGEIRFAVRASDGIESDGLTLSVPVSRLLVSETASAYGQVKGGSAREPVEIPADLIPDESRIGVVLSPSVIGNIDGAFRYMRDYPYGCWEQRLSKGLMAALYLSLRKYLPADLQWPEADSVVTGMIADAGGFQAPNGGMAFFEPIDDRVNPYLSAFTAIGFQWLREMKREIPAEVDRKLDEYLLALLRKDVFPDGASKGMASSVRAVALTAMAAKKKAVPADLARYEGALDQMDLFGKAYLLRAALSLDPGGATAEKARASILSHANESGGKISFQETVTDGFQQMLASTTRSQCAVLSALIELREKGGKGVSDLPMKAARAVSQSRGKLDHWENTQENIFCMKALLDYSKVFEAEPPAGEFTVKVGETQLGAGRFKTARDEAQIFNRALDPKEPGTKTAITIQQPGSATLYYAARLKMTPREPFKEPADAGLEIKRQYSIQRDGEWKVLKDPITLKRGDIVRVDLYLWTPAQRNFVVVEDPVPGGVEPVNRDLKTSSQTDADKAELPLSGDSFWYEAGDWFVYGVEHWGFYHKELKHDVVRFYSDSLNPGNYHLAYIGQVIAPGEFSVLPPKAEEMYDPDVFGRGAAGRLEVRE